MLQEQLQLNLMKLKRIQLLIKLLSYIYLKIFYIDDLKIVIIINYLFLRLIIQLLLASGGGGRSGAARNGRR